MYTVIRNLISSKQAEELAQRLDTFDLEYETRDTGGSSQVYLPFNDVLMQVQPHIEEFVGELLYPTFSFGRKYHRYSYLVPHIDRESCEFTVTINLKNSGNPWPIWLRDDSDYVEIELNPGDALVLEGSKYQHWRDSLDEEFVYQAFLHYVRQNGKYAQYKFDGHSKLSTMYD